MRDIEPGCEQAVKQTERWTQAPVDGRFDELELILAPDFQFTVDPRFGGGRMNKQQFIAFDRNIRSCSIDLQKVVARKMGPFVTMLILAEVSEEFAAELPAGMPSRQEMSETMQGAKLAYGSGWKQN